MKDTGLSLEASRIPLFIERAFAVLIEFDIGLVWSQRSWKIGPRPFGLSLGGGRLTYRLNV